MTFMTFFVLLIALLIERFFDWSHLRHWQWVGLLQQKVAQLLPDKQPWLVLACTVLPVILAVGFIGFLLNGALYGVATLLFQLVVLLYCLGPKNLWADGFACINAIAKGDAKAAAEKLKSMFGITEVTSAQDGHKQLLGKIFLEANQRVFAVAFWFSIFGPIGALSYRMIAVSASDDKQPAVSNQARLAEKILDWLPVRVFTFIFALGGHFVQVINHWRKKVLLSTGFNDVLLTECGIAALGFDPDANIADNGSAERDALGLLDRVFVIMLVVVLVLAMVS